MEPFTEAMLGVLTLLDSPAVSIYWLYLLGAAALATFVFVRLQVRRGRKPTLRGLVRYLLPRRILWHRSSANDVGLFVINTLVYSFAFVVPLQAMSTALASGTWAWLHEQVGALSVPVTGWPLWVGATVGIFVMADLAFFIAHRMAHRVPVLWELHKVHHSAPVLNPFTVFRRHPMEIAFESTVSGIVLGLTYGTIGWLGGEVVMGHEILGVNFVLFVLLFVGFNLQHSHVWVRFGRLERILISPAAHQIHHSCDPAHYDRNFGNLLSIWDHWAGTHESPAERPSELRFGLGAETSAYRTLLRLYLVPLIRIVRRNKGDGGGTDSA